MFEDPKPGRRLLKPKGGVLGSIAALILAVIVVAIVWQGNRRAPESPGEHGDIARGTGTGIPQRPERHAERADPDPAARSHIGFRSRGALDEHFRKHGREFGTISLAQYLKRAQDLRDAPMRPSRELLEVRRHDGVITRFDRRSGEFIAFNPDLTIRTFFKPDAGEAYFHRQAQREGEP